MVATAPLGETAVVTPGSTLIVKVAVTLLAAIILTVQAFALIASHPVHEAKTDPATGEGVSVTTAPPETVALPEAKKESVAGPPVAVPLTVPLPVPVKDTFSGNA